jgi:5-methylcytosine-specific restriction protein A
MVTLADVTAEGVMAAIAEFDRLGGEKFRQTTNFGRARAYFLEYNGQLYDSKAIAGYAHGVSTDAPLAPGDFTGGDKTVARRLEALGFTVRYLPYTDWAYDEIVLACELSGIPKVLFVTRGQPGAGPGRGGGQHLVR